ncbi:TPA: hypothetical protein PW931_004823 [Escherichia coli]|uniref:hypothetical protein n=1 Tax=Escherichia coli TaxID=562 RepID=UPI00169498F0|nr:hypothetical protein [Escherichia coli]EFH3931058.1 hypothetical protein [Escherichia coli]EFH7310409.1 hypothetical protein [Escherichia coli]EFH8495595.1 hypothetical protein [Escherichia coli]EFK1518165.1 hypothetical protein [Escherichia coli]EFL9543120.1 hypothetical protein [Escherichia coli]
MFIRNLFIGGVIAILAYFLFAYAGIKISGSLDCLISNYKTYMRGYVFSSFLGISSFLLSLLTFVVINLKEKMFDSEDYLDIYRKGEELSENDPIKKSDLYKPLLNITYLLVLSIAFCLLTCLLQFSLGFSVSKKWLIAPTIMPFFALSFMSLSLTAMTQLVCQWLKSEEFIKAKKP